MSTSNLVIMNRESNGGKPPAPVAVGAKSYDDFAVLEIEIGDTKIDFYLDDLDSVAAIGAQIIGAVAMLGVS